MNYKAGDKIKMVAGCFSIPAGSVATLEPVVEDGTLYLYAGLCRHVQHWELLSPTDSIVASVIKKFQERSDVGVKKYGVTLDRTDLSTLDWLTRLQEELMDAVNYIERLKKETV